MVSGCVPARCAIGTYVARSLDQGEAELDDHVVFVAQNLGNAAGDPSRDRLAHRNIHENREGLTS